MTNDPFSAARAAAAVLAERTGTASHDVAVILGSGWSPAADALGPAASEMPVTDLGFPPTTVPGHEGLVRSVDVSGRRTLVFLGRLHLYEGHSPATVVHGVRTAAAAGCRVIVLTNAAGGVNPTYSVGQLVLISDHLNLTGTSPLSGPPPPEGYGPRFTDLTDLYSPRLRRLAIEETPDLVEGVYAALHGPNYETPAEIAMIALLGADLVGMSTALEAIAARHLGTEVLGLSLVTNAAAGVGHTAVEHEEVVAAGLGAARSLGAFLAGIIARL